MLTAGDGAGGDFFGISVALSGETAVVGASGATVDGRSGQGAVYAFTRSNGAWSERQKITAPDLFGVRLALDGETLLAGAWLADVSWWEDEGAAYLFRRSEDSWRLQRKLLGAGAAAGDQFGLDVALDGDTAVAGATGSDEGQGKVYFFERANAPVYLPLVRRPAPWPPGVPNGDFEAGRNGAWQESSTNNWQLVVDDAIVDFPGAFAPRSGE
jgi:hypothetical protein